MKFSPEHAAIVAQKAQEILSNGQSKESQVEELWATIAYIQAMVLAKKLRNTVGNKVYSGPFKSMQLTEESMVGAYAPWLAGIYEHELHPTFEEVIATPYQNILNIGCSFGYYTTGLALRLPNVKIFAFDISEKEQHRCRDMITLNKVSDRVIVSGLFEGKNFANYENAKTLVLMDIEGGETKLLDPIHFPALKKMDVIVELHDNLDPSTSKEVMDRFAPTHTLSFIPNRPQLFDLKAVVGNHYIDPFESLLLGWEKRTGPTPWAIMRVNN